MKIAFIGYGELGRQIHTLIQQTGSATEAIFFDDGLYQQKQVNAFPFETYPDELYKDYSFIVSLGYKQLPAKQKIIKRLDDLGRSIYSFIHPSCFVNTSAMIENGVVAYPMCNIDKEVKIGKGVLLNNSVTISHNTAIGNCCYVSPGVVLSGNVTIGENTFIGAGAIVANNITIGINVTIGIGTVVTEDVADNSAVIGNPMKFVNGLHLV
jgi:sugar O-acyltransferase (sialic acid O-acetyltransferase NeuD family)